MIDENRERLRHIFIENTATTKLSLRSAAISQFIRY